MAGRCIPVPWRQVRRVSVMLVITGLVGVTDAVAQGHGASPEHNDQLERCRATASGAFNNPAGVTLADALQGRLPGVTVTAMGGGAASGAASFRLRGTNSLESNTPLLFVDDLRIQSFVPVGPRGLYGVPVLEFVELSHIKRIEVLRGPSATLRYGQGASAGVIRIYTRRGGEESNTPRRHAADCPTP